MPTDRILTLDPRPERLGAGETHVLREEVSEAGRTVRLTLDRGNYKGSRPYYTVAYLKPSGNPQALRYTPFLERARFLFDRFREDVIDPARFAVRPPDPPGESEGPRPTYRACRRHRPVWRLACVACNPEYDGPDYSIRADWKKTEAAVKRRDGHRCKHCGTRERLTVHHIKPRPDGSHDPKNLVTLCTTCHDAVELPAERRA